MKIVVGGYIVGYPLGGMTWHHLNYLLGLQALGHDLTYLEDGAYLPPFDPTTGNSGDASFGLQHLQDTFDTYGLEIPWHYRFGDLSAGVSMDEIQRGLRDADLLVCVSGITPLDWYDRPKRTLVIDTDPVFTQLRMNGDQPFLDYYKSFTHAATFGRLIGTSESPLPTHGIDWIPTNQPISLPHWPVVAPRSRSFTTLGKWEHSARSVEFHGKSFASTKAIEWQKLIDLPGRTPWELRMAMASMPPDQRSRFESNGWRFDDPAVISATCESFRSFVADSAGELTVAKQIYAAVPSGWFSDRSACYLASGRPVVTQTSGFEKWLPSGEGLFSFSTADQAADSLCEIASDPARHALAARRVAEQCFDSTQVLSDLLDRVR